MAETDPAPGVEHPTEVLAQHGFDLVHSDPARAVEALRAVADDPAASPRAAVLAHWGLGRLHHDVGDMQEATAAFHLAIDLAAEHGLVDESPKITLSLSSTLMLVGEPHAALAGLDEAEPMVAGAMLGRLLTQRALVLSSLGRIDEALADSDRALELLRADGDVVGEIRLLVNRSVMMLPLGRTAQVRRELAVALELAERSEQHVLVAGAAHNLGYLDFLLGRVPSALRAFALARERYASFGSGRNNAVLDVDEARLLLTAGFPEEAMEIAVRLIDDAVAQGNVHQHADGELVAAHAQLLMGSTAAAEQAARRAAELFRSAGREPWTALAEYLGAMAVSREDPADAIPTLRSAAATLDALGWQAEAAEVLVRLGSAALAAGEIELARDALGQASVVRRRTSIAVRAAAWHATALLRLLDDQPVAARRAIDAGLRVVDRYRASLGASDLRARASIDGVELAELGLRLAMDTGRARDVLVAAERWRAGSLVVSTTRVGGEREIDHDLAELRRLASQLRGVGSALADRDTVLTEVVRLERRITSMTRMAPGDPRAIGRRLDLAELRRQLGDAALVEYIDLDGQLSAVVVTRRRTEVVHLGPRDVVAAIIDHALFSLRRLSATPKGHPRAATVLAQHRQTLSDLDAALVGPLRLAADDLVIVPTRLLHAVPWWALAGLQLAGRMVVAPSAAWWMGETADEPHGSGVLLAHGPRLPQAESEVAAIAEVVGVGSPATVLRGSAATVDAVLDGMERAGLVHIAAHGRFRADNPMFSSLQLADGLLYVHDLDRLQQTPHTVVLTACSAARAGVYGGDELLGTSVALLALGVRSVVAPLLPVRDDSAMTLAVELHRQLRDCVDVPTAVAAAVRAIAAGDDPGLLAAATSMLCISRRIR